MKILHFRTPIMPFNDMKWNDSLDSRSRFKALSLCGCIFLITRKTCCQLFIFILLKYKKYVHFLQFCFHLSRSHSLASRQYAFFSLHFPTYFLTTIFFSGALACFLAIFFNEFMYFFSLLLLCTAPDMICE